MRLSVLRPISSEAAPATPQELTQHSCLNIRLPTAGSLYAWEFARDGRTLDVRVDGQFTCNSVLPVLSAALDGLGLAYVPYDLAEPYLASGKLIQLLADWCPYFQGYYLYYPHRRQASPAFRQRNVERAESFVSMELAATSLRALFQSKRISDITR